MGVKKIGISAAFFHPDPNRAVFHGKTLLYVVESLPHWVMSRGALAYIIPSNPNGMVGAKDLVNELDGLVLQGGADVAPESYGEKPIKPEWSGDVIRDRYEIELVRRCVELGKPILGICRGMQLLNVALGGTLYQDITTQVPNALAHRNAEIYEKNYHTITIEPGSHLSNLFTGKKTAKINSVHHQAVKDLGKDLVIEARSEKDRVVEAVRSKTGYVVGLQWHPEFQSPKESDLIDGSVILDDFLSHA
jgi:putative glutamine amidotransferase